MAGKVFINYRRSLSLKDAQLLYGALQRQFGARGVFLDVSGLDGGDHWLHTLEHQVDASAAVVSLLTQGWADVLDEKGQRRLDNPNDFVRFELARAFSRSIPVLPVLVDGAEMPDVSRLPTNLLPLSFPQAMRLRSETLEDDAERIAKRLRYLMAQNRPRGLSYWSAGAAAAVAMTAGVAAGPFALGQLGLYKPDASTTGEDNQLRSELRATKASLTTAVNERDTAAATVKKAQAEVEAAQRRQAALEGDLKDEKTKLADALRDRDTALAELKTARADAEGWKQRHAALEKRLNADAALVNASKAPASAPKQTSGEPRPGETFRDCDDGCPEMVVVPAGAFMMGEGGRAKKVTIPRSFAVGKFEVTFAEWEVCVAAGDCKGNQSPADRGWGKGRQPVINVSWNDAQEYVAWLSRKTAKTYRLLTEDEWEYAARAGTTTTYAWGNEVGNGNANCSGCGSQWDGKQTAPVGSFKANGFGLHDMHGNVLEWVEGCRPNLSRSPIDVSAAPDIIFKCSRYVRGGSWISDPRDLRAANRGYYLFREENRGHYRENFRNDYLGFRLART